MTPSLAIKLFIILFVSRVSVRGRSAVKNAYEKIQCIILNLPRRVVTGPEALKGQSVSTASVMIFFIATFVLPPYYHREKHYDLITLFCGPAFNKFK